MAIEVVNSPAPQTPLGGEIPAFSDVTPSDFMPQAAGIVAALRPSTPEALSVVASRVLTVEPDEDWRTKYAKWGTESGHEVVGVPTVPEALKQLNEGRFDLVITSRQDGLWPHVHTEAQAQGARTVVVSGDTFSLGRISRSTEDAAKERGIEFIRKGGGTRIELGKLFASLGNEDRDDSTANSSKADEHQSYTEYVNGLINRWYPMPTEVDPVAADQPNGEKPERIDYSSPFRIRVTRDSRDPEEYGPAGDLSGQFGVCLGLFNQETLEPDEKGSPLLLTDSGDKIWGDRSWCDPNPEAHADIPFEDQQAALDLYIADIKAKMGIDTPPQTSEDQ
ncbi:MAG: hypothetical protein Q8Q49_01400 [bacterium]|nr:hypothetical protein [bacterium]